MIPTFSDGGIRLVYLPEARAFLVVVVDDTAGLQVGVDRYRTHILEAALLHVFADSVGETVADRDRPDIMPLIQDRFATREAPDVIAEAAMLFAHLNIASGIVDHRLHLAQRADHTFRIQDAIHIIIIVSGNLVIVKIFNVACEFFVGLGDREGESVIRDEKISADFQKIFLIFLVLLAS